MRRTPFHGRHVAAGARMVPFAGFEMPIQYAGIREEHLATRARAGLFDVSHMGEIRFRGPKAEASLTWLLSNAIRRMEPGQAQYNALCNERGGVVDDVFVYKLADDDFIVCVNAANREKDFAWVTEHDREGADIVDEGDDWAQIAIQGPEAVEIVDLLVDFDARAVPRHHFRHASFADVDGCLIARTGYTGEDGFEVFVPAGDAPPVWDRVLDAGVNHGLVPVGLGARDTLRLEVRNALYGHELNDDTTPLQSGLGWIVKLAKPGGFLGSDAIAARKDEGRVVVGMVVEGKRIAREGMDVLSEGRVVGRVTSGTLGPSVDRAICLAFVDRELASAGTRLTIDVRGKEAVGVVVDGPFYKRS
ncbi:MAG: glycine cleavage system aminomethyltransferase GcvT [Alphaproteobacteria bacterium]|nr:glycine cleavage system aminomethyltransferase GcvT [Alphaproteobacteria bacterium]